MVTCKSDTCGVVQVANADIGAGLAAVAVVLRAYLDEIVAGGKGGFTWLGRLQGWLLKIHIRINPHHNK